MTTHSSQHCRAILALVPALALACLTGCVGKIGELLPGGSTQAELTCGQAPELRRLNGEQYRAVINRLLPETSAVAGLSVPFAEARRADFFSTWSEHAGVGEYEVDDVWSAADAVATLWTSDSAHICAGPQKAACVRRVWAAALAVLWSRPPSDDEVDELAQALEEAETELTPEIASATVMRAALMSPGFLFRAEGLGGIMTAQEVAASLSFTLQGQPPDAELQRFAAGTPDPELIRVQAARLMATPSEVPALRRFLHELFQYERAADAQKDTGAYPFHHPADLIDDTTRVIDRLLDEHGRTGLLRALLTSDLVYVRPSTADSWQVTSPGEAGGFVHEPARVGVLTHPAWLVAMSHPAENHLVRRGLFVRERLLCGEVPPIPGGVVPRVPDIPGQTLRERIATHSTNPACVTCHRLMDPLGAAFEGWDHLGRPQTVDDGGQVDTTGELDTGDGHEVAYADAHELMQRLASSATVEACWVTQLYRFVHGRDVRASDQCELDRLTALYATGEDSLAVIAEMFASPEYLDRSAPMHGATR